MNESDRNQLQTSKHGNYIAIVTHCWVILGKIVYGFRDINLYFYLFLIHGAPGMLKNVIYFDNRYVHSDLSLREKRLIHH